MRPPISFAARRARLVIPPCGRGNPSGGRLTAAAGQRVPASRSNGPDSAAGPPSSTAIGKGSSSGVHPSPARADWLRLAPSSSSSSSNSSVEILGGAPEGTEEEDGGGKVEGNEDAGGEAEEGFDPDEIACTKGASKLSIAEDHALRLATEERMLAAAIDRSNNTSVREAPPVIVLSDDDE